MAIRMIQERQSVENGGQQVLVRVLLERRSGSTGPVEVTALVRVPMIASDGQVEAAAREMAKRALQEALAAFP